MCFPEGLEDTPLNTDFRPIQSTLHKFKATEKSCLMKHILHKLILKEPNSPTIFIWALGLSI